MDSCNRANALILRNYSLQSRSRIDQIFHEMCTGRVRELYGYKFTRVGFDFITPKFSPTIARTQDRRVTTLSANLFNVESLVVNLGKPIHKRTTRAILTSFGESRCDWLVR